MLACTRLSPASVVTVAVITPSKKATGAELPSPPSPREMPPSKAGATGFDGGGPPAQGNCISVGLVASPCFSDQPPIAPGAGSYFARMVRYGAAIEGSNVRTPASQSSPAQGPFGWA